MGVLWSEYNSNDDTLKRWIEMHKDSIDREQPTVKVWFAKEMSTCLRKAFLIWKHLSTHKFSDYKVGPLSEIIQKPGAQSIDGCQRILVDFSSLFVLRPLLTRIRNRSNFLLGKLYHLFIFLVPESRQFGNFVFLERDTNIGYDNSYFISSLVP